MQALLSIPGIPEPFNEPRQSLPKVYWQIGYLDLIRTRTILKKIPSQERTLLPLKIDSRDSIDIDDEFSFQLAEFCLERRGSAVESSGGWPWIHWSQTPQ